EISSPRFPCEFFSTSASLSPSLACLSDEVLDFSDHRGQVLLEQIHIPDEQTGDAVLFEQLALGRRLLLSFLRIEPGVYLAVYFDGLASTGQIKIHGVQAVADPLFTFELDLQTSQEVDHQPLGPGWIGELPGLPSHEERVYAVTFDCDSCAF